MTAVRVLLADDHLAFAEALAMRVALETDLVVVAVATSASSAESLSRALRPDVLVLDLEFHDGDGLDIARRLYSDHVVPNVVIVTHYGDEDTATRAVGAGVAAFVCKDTGADDLVRVIRQAHRGECWVEPRLLRGVFARLASVPEPTDEERLLARLTTREREILELLAAGRDRAAIAAELYLSTNTVRTHVRNILAKLELHSSLEAAALLLQQQRRVRDGGLSGATPPVR